MFKSQYLLQFYRPNHANGIFSNFYPCPKLEIDGKQWPTTEHYFQAQKFVGSQKVEAIRNATTPSEAFKMGRQRDSKFPIRDDWNQVRIDVMREALFAKYQQNQEFKEFLQNTGTCQIVEHTPKDYFWADGGNGKGQNMLGKLLMELRYKLFGKDIQQEFINIEDDQNTKIKEIPNQKLNRSSKTIKKNEQKKQQRKSPKRQSKTQNK